MQINCASPVSFQGTESVCSPGAVPAEAPFANGCLGAVAGGRTEAGEATAFAKPAFEAGSAGLVADELESEGKFSSFSSGASCTRREVS